MTDFSAQTKQINYVYARIFKRCSGCHRANRPDSNGNPEWLVCPTCGTKAEIGRNKLIAASSRWLYIKGKAFEMLQNTKLLINNKVGVLFRRK